MSVRTSFVFFWLLFFSSFFLVLFGELDFGFDNFDNNKIKTKKKCWIYLSFCFIIIFFSISFFSLPLYSSNSRILLRFCFVFYLIYNNLTIFPMGFCSQSEQNMQHFKYKLETHNTTALIYCWTLLAITPFLCNFVMLRSALFFCCFFFSSSSLFSLV